MPGSPALIHGVDVSNHQPNWRPDKGDAFTFVLTSDGHSWKSPTHDAQVKLARQAGQVVGHYHWLRPGNIQAQADWFVKYANPKAGDILVCDWEQAGATNGDKDQFIKAVQKLRPGNRVLLYCNPNYWLNYDHTSFVGDGLWIAAYDVAAPGIKAPWLFWQYADHPNTDQNQARFASKQALIDWANFKSTPSTPSTPSPAPTPAPKPAAAPIHPTLDAIHTPFGAWGTSWSWNRQTAGPHKGEGQHGGDDWHRGAGLAEIGDPIVAVTDGTVIYAGDARHDGGRGWGAAFGIHVLIQWSHGGRTSIDAHMSKVAVKTGQHVTAGQKIGEKGMTGNVSGPHDHHEQHLGALWTSPRVKPIYPSHITPAATPSKPKPRKQRTGPNGQHLYEMWVTRNGLRGYWMPPKVGKVRHTRKKGFKVVGYPVRRSDGRYLRTVYGTDYPLSGLSHHQPKK